MELPQTKTKVSRDGFSIVYNGSCHSAHDVPTVALFCPEPEQDKLHGHLSAVSDELTAYLRSIGIGGDMHRYKCWALSNNGKKFMRSLGKLNEGIIFLEGDYSTNTVVLQQPAPADAPLFLTGYLENDARNVLGMCTPRYMYTVYRHEGKLRSNLSAFDGSLAQLCNEAPGAVYSLNPVPLRAVSNSKRLCSLLANAYRRIRQKVILEEREEYPFTLADEPEYD